MLDLKLCRDLKLVNQANEKLAEPCKWTDAKPCFGLSSTDLT